MSDLDPHERPPYAHRMANRPYPVDPPLFALRPSFLPERQMPTHLALGVFFGLWGSLFFGGLVTITLQSFGYTGSPWGPVAASGFLFLAVLPTLKYRRLQRVYDDMVLSLYPDRLEFHGEGRHTILPRERIQGIRLEGLTPDNRLGTLVVAAAGTDGRSAPLFVPDVPAPAEARAKLLGWLAGDGTSVPDRRVA